MVLGEGKDKNVLMSFPCLPLGSSPRTLAVNGKGTVIRWAAWIHPDNSPCPASRGVRKCLVWVADPRRQASPCISPGALCGEGWCRCVYRQEAQGKRRSPFHSSSHLLLAFSSGVASGQKRMGIWQSESIALCLPTAPSHLPPEEARLDLFLYPHHLTLRDLKFPSYY